MEQEISALIAKGAISHVKESPQAGFFSTIFLVPKKDGKTRSVIILRVEQVHHNNMEGIQSVKDLMLQVDWMTGINLKDAYFVVPVHQDHQQYL